MYLDYYFVYLTKLLSKSVGIALCVLVVKNVAQRHSQKLRSRSKYIFLKSHKKVKRLAHTKTINHEQRFMADSRISIGTRCGKGR